MWKVLKYICCEWFVHIHHKKWVVWSQKLRSVNNFYTRWNNLLIKKENELKNLKQNNSHHSKTRSKHKKVQMNAYLFYMFVICVKVNKHLFECLFWFDEINYQKVSWYPSDLFEDYITVSCLFCHHKNILVFFFSWPCLLGSH